MSSVPGSPRSARRRQGHDAPTSLSPREFGAALGVGESTIKRWVDAGLLNAARTIGGHRRIAIEEAMRFADARGMPLRNSAVLHMLGADGAPPEPIPESLAPAVLDALLGGDEASLCKLCGTRLAGRGAAAVIDGPIRSAMAKIGELWQSSRDGIAIEHRATRTLLRVLLSHERTRSCTPEGRRIAVGGVVEGDFHSLGSVAASLVLAGLGWHTSDFGACVPTDSLIRAAAHHGASLVWLSASIAGDEDRSARLGAIAGSVAAGVSPGCMVVVGGHGFDAVALPKAANLASCSTMTELEEFAASLPQGRAEAAGPEVTSASAGGASGGTIAGLTPA